MWQCQKLYRKQGDAYGTIVATRTVKTISNLTVQSLFDRLWQNENWAISGGGVLWLGHRMLHYLSPQWCW